MAAARDQALQAFLDALKAAVEAGESSASPQAATAAERAFAALEEAPGEAAAPPRETVHATHCIEGALADSRNGPAAALAEAFERIEPRLAWRRRLDRHTSDPNFPNAHASTIIIGDGGIELRDDVRIGVSLLAPNTFYPDHHHPPEEVYVVLTEGAWRQGDGPWNERGPGTLVYNTPNVIHAMQSGSKPLLAIWTLPMNDAAAAA
ncbi:MAG: quercetin dioxygenase-like cupin family protein [Gammaproteobacteria bacterium]|jgi:quercetin dioxygenase-like cupin family protein